MKTQTLRMMGILICLSLFSACGVKSGSDESGANQDGPLTIEGTTSWLMDLIIPSSYASSEFCPKGFYPSPLSTQKVSEEKISAMNAEAVDELVTTATKDDTTENVTCPNTLTSCDSKHGCAFLSSVSPENGKQLLCVVPVNKLNQYKFEFTEQTEMEAGIIEVIGRKASVNLKPESCLAEKVNNGYFDEVHILGFDENNYECLPNPVEYRKITFEVDGNQVVADSNPDTTIESDLKAEILMTPSKTLKEEMMKVKDSIIAELKSIYEGSDFNSADVIKTMSDQEGRRNQLFERITKEGSLDFGKVNEELQEALEVGKAEDPRKLSHIHFTVGIVESLTQSFTENRDLSIEEKEKIQDLQKNLSKKKDEVKSKAIEIQYNDTTSFDKPVLGVREKKILDDLVSAISAVEAVDAGTIMFKRMNISKSDSLLASVSSEACSLEKEDEFKDEDTIRESFDLQTQLDKMSYANDLYMKSLEEQMQAIWDETYALDEERSKLYDEMHAITESSTDSLAMINKFIAIKSGLLDQREALVMKEALVRKNRNLTMIAFAEKNLAAVKMAIAINESRMNATTDEVELKKLSEIGNQLSASESEYQAYLKDATYRSGYDQFKIGFNVINIQIKTTYEKTDDLKFLAEYMNNWANKDPSQDFSAQLKSIDSKIDALSAIRATKEGELKEMQLEFDAYRGGTSVSK